MMKKIFLILFICITTTALLFAGFYLDRFTAKSENGNVIIEWKTGEESSVSRFEIERKSGSNNEFILIASINPKGNNSEYQYIDRSAYKTTDAIYTYRLKIIDKNPSISPIYSNSISVNHKVSSVKSTWGSIKSMFR
jgi:hypothetical protein